MIFQYEFVEHVPEKMKEGILYISLPFSTAMHLCPCGCGNEVVTKLSPERWKLTFDGETVSLYPSIGNWSFECKSHYWIINNKIEFARKFTKKEISEVQKKDIEVKKKYYIKNKKKEN